VIALFYLTESTTPKMETFLTTAQAAEILGFHRVSVAWSIRNGLLKATRFGRAWFIRPNDLRE
jgi:excisionase family DNA binding protein